MEDERVDIVLPDKEESQRFWQEQHILLKWAQSLTQKQIDFLCNGGWYNETIKGYALAAAKEADFSDAQIKELLQCLHYVLDTKDKEDADRIYHEF